MYGKGPLLLKPCPRGPLLKQIASTCKTRKQTLTNKHTRTWVMKNTETNNMNWCKQCQMLTVPVLQCSLNCKLTVKGLSLCVFPQAEVCSGTVAEVIQSVVNGADGCIFCFGQVKLGKLLHWQQIREVPLLAKENSHCSLLATLDVHNWLSGALGWVKEWVIEGKGMDSESGVGVRGKVLHSGFRAQSVIKILVIGLASVLRLKGLLFSCSCFQFL